MPVSVDHYENFPVASWLCPPRLRPPIAAIYRFARTADDIADEGDATRGRARSPTSAAYRADLAARSAPARRRPPRWPTVFEPLARAIAAHRLPVRCSADLLDAFAQDVAADALRRPRRAARLLPPLGQPDRPPAAAPLRHRRRRARWRSPTRSARALQLANFWQDLGVDTPRGRLYVPRADCAPPRRRASDAARAAATAPRCAPLVAELVAWARELMLRGAPLVARDRPAAPAGSCAWSSRAACACSRRSSASAAPRLPRRPTLGWRDAPADRLARAAHARTVARRSPAPDADARAHDAPEQYVQEKAAAQRLELLLRLPVPAAAAARRDHRLLCLLPRGRRRRRRGAATPASPRPSWPGGASEVAPALRRLSPAIR